MARRPSVLTDNGCIYTAAHRGGKVVMETLLETLGVTYKHSSPYHPQTCGKVERFHQTEKKFLAKQAGAADLAQLQTQLDRFVAYYNQARPHRGIGRRTPAEVFAAKVKAHPAPARSPHPFPGPPRPRRQDRLRDTAPPQPADPHRHRPSPQGRTDLLLVADRDVRVVNEDGEPIRQLTIDPSRDYQGRGLG